MNSILVGNNAKIVYKLVLEFLNTWKNIEVDKDFTENHFKYLRKHYTDQKASSANIDSLNHIYTLARIIKDYGVIPIFSKDKLKEKIIDEYNKRLTSEEAESSLSMGFSQEVYIEGYSIGIENFIRYREIIVCEKNVFGFKNMVIIYKAELDRAINEHS